MRQVHDAAAAHPVEAANILAQVCRALEAAHDEGAGNITGSFAVKEQVAAPARGISTAMEGLSRNCVLFPDATMCVSMYVMGSICPLLFKSL